MQDSLLAKEEAVENVPSLRLQLEQCRQEFLETQKRQEQLEDIFANVADAIIASDTEGRIVEVNRAACELLGYTKEELLLMHPWDFVTSATREEILALIQNAEQGVCLTVP
ncbi:MAG: PAS domain S-box protein, partial [Prosthecobacter sp.]|nr:PAS domain S-box protein [Prosthecobacter sp.]